jgi:hypothetical protein
MRFEENIFSTEFAPMPNQTLGIMQPMNPIVDSLIPSNFNDPVSNMAPYGYSQPLGGIQEAINVLTLTDFLLR